MNIRTKLLIYIVSIVTVLNSVAFFLFQGNRSAEAGYNEIIQQLLLFNQISNDVNDNLRKINLYIVNQSQELRNSSRDGYQSLKHDQTKLDNVVERPDNYIQLKNYKNLIRTFLNQENTIFLSITSHDPMTYTNVDREMENTAGYIQQTTQSIIDSELSFYSTFYQEIVRRNDQLKNIGIDIFAVSTILSIFVAIALAKGITEPLSNLMRAARRMAKGDLEGEEIAVKSRDEVGVLSEAFNHMQQNIRLLVGQIRIQSEMERHVKELELKALQSQINPHFLFNTLNTIAKLSYMEGAEQASDLITSVSSLLRYNLQKLDKPVTLREELENVKEYLSIQKARFRDRVEYHLKIEENALDLLVPCLTLQPIIENAFVHGIEELEAGATLYLEILNCGQGAEIIVCDNGKGMGKETQEKLLQSLQGNVDGTDFNQEKKRSTGIGLANVGKRLSLFFEDRHRPEVESDVDQGTTIRLWIPSDQKA
ncbi:sensor histidine kinase [Fodinisporobacter ferrooxydans]|uniref:Sensor histidine kinase n=1 Tax=Fodinisporobacter ferrooxydans TaxID=2901836 RepID=A0ABY4CLR3_9BACL|nr:sensor histidine kinase [Alicyclobacillaceae bacterium MYW30-H2]